MTLAGQFFLASASLEDPSSESKSRNSQLQMGQAEAWKACSQAMQSRRGAHCSVYRPVCVSVYVSVLLLCCLRCCCSRHLLFIFLLLFYMSLAEQGRKREKGSCDAHTRRRHSISTCAAKDKSLRATEDHSAPGTLNMSIASASGGPAASLLAFLAFTALRKSSLEMGLNSTAALATRSIMSAA